MTRFIISGIPCESYVHKCEMLIDFGQYIGDRHLGHSCPNPAEYKLDNDAVVCSECISRLAALSERVRFPPRVIPAFGFTSKNEDR